MAKEYKDLVIGLDIGTSKIMAVVAEVMPDGQLKIAGLGIAPGNGLKRGVVVNIDATVQSIQQALKEAELMADDATSYVEADVMKAAIKDLHFQQASVQTAIARLENVRVQSPWATPWPWLSLIILALLIAQVVG